MKQIFRSAIIISLLLLLVGMVDAGGIPEAQQKKITLGFQQWYHGETYLGKVMDWYIDEFEKSHPGVEVKPASITNEMYWDKLSVDIAGNLEGDIIAYDSTMIDSYYYMRPGGSFISLDKYIKGYTLPDGTSIEKDIMYYDSVKRDGHIIGLPQCMLIFPNMFYRKSQFKEVGLSADSMKTWDGFEQGATKLMLKNSDGTVARYGFGHPVYAEVLSRWCHMHWLWTAGGGIFRNDAGGPYTPENLIFNSPENLFAVEYLADLVKKASPPGNKKMFELYPMFYEGNLAMAEFALWGVSFCKDNMKPEGSFETDLGMMPFPAAEYKGQIREPIYIVWFCPLGISSRCKYPKVAFDFIALIHNKEVQERCARQNTPVNKLVLETSYKRDYPVQYAFIQIATNYKTNMVPQMPQFGQIDNILQQALNAALLGSKSSKDALDWGQSEIKKLLK